MQVAPIPRKRPGAPSLALSSSLKSLNESTASLELSADVVQQESKYKFTKQDLEFQKLLGAGSGGSVSRVMYRVTKQLMACKVIKGLQQEEDDTKTKQRITRELRILRLCRSPQIVSFYGAFLNDQDVYILMEYMDFGSLESIYKKIGPIPEPIVAVVGRSVLEGLIYLYSHHKIVHRDIKPSNILVSRNGQIKIADFGVSKELVGGTMAMTFTGTQGYLAVYPNNQPERVREGSNCSGVADVWSLGLTLFEIATAKFPFPPEAMNSIMDLLQWINEEPSPTLPADLFSTEFNWFVGASLHKDSTRRATPQQLLESPFITLCKDIDVGPWCESIAALLDTK